MATGFKESMKLVISNRAIVQANRICIQKNPAGAIEAMDCLQTVLVPGPGNDPMASFVIDEKFINPILQVIVI